MSRSQLELKESIIHKEGRVFCMCCSNVKDYTVSELKLGTIIITACDDCLVELKTVK